MDIKQFKSNFFDFIEYRTELDINGWSEQDIFKH